MSKTDLKPITIGFVYGVAGHWAVSSKKNDLKMVWHHEPDKNLNDIFKVNFPCVFSSRSDEELYSREIPDIVVGSPPCSAFACMLGSIRGGYQAELMEEFASHVLEFGKIINRIQPKIFIFENVTGLFNQGKLFYTFLSSVKKNYQVNFLVLDSADYGAAQHRVRIFVFGTRSDISPEFMFIPSEHFQKSLILRDVIKGLENLSRLCVEDHDWYQGTQKIFGTFSRKGVQFSYSWDSPPSTCITTNAYGNLHPDKTRCISVLELKRIIGLPDNFNLGDFSVQKKVRILAFGVDVRLCSLLLKNVKQFLRRDVRVKKGCFYLPRPSMTHYKGSFPLNLESMLLKFLNIQKEVLILQPFGGRSALGLRLDVKREVQPDVIGDAHYLPFREGIFDLILADPPYSNAESVNLYQTKKISFRVYSKELVRTIKLNGLICFYHKILLPTPDGCIKHAIITVVTRTFHHARIITVIKKIQGGGV
jgi:site-specific DNA-cytosine methylase